MLPPKVKEYIEKAREMYHDEGAIEIDDTPDDDVDAAMMISREAVGERGAYVKAWVWVPRETIQPEWEG